MTPATYNILETIVRALYQVADAALEKEEASNLRHELGQQLTQAKVAMQRGREDDIVQDMAGVVVALAKFVLGRKPTVDDVGRLQRKHLRTALRDLERRYKERREVTEAVLHPDGRCTCAGEGTCSWCQTHCVHCGAKAEQHGPGSTHYFEPHGEGHEPDPELQAERDEYELQHGGELRKKEPEELSEPEEPVIEDKTLEDIGIDRNRWRLITDAGGYPAVALYFNGTKDSLSQEQVEELEAVLAPIIMGWGR